jgi:hypothetical protein
LPDVVVFEVDDHWNVSLYTFQVVALDCSRYGVEFRGYGSKVVSPNSCKKWKDCSKTTLMVNFTYLFRRFH